MPVLPLLREAVALEAASWRSMYVWLRRKPLTLGAGDEAFSYLGVVKPILGVFIGLSAVEVPIFDLIVRRVVPWEPARWIVLALGVWGLLWMIGLFASMKVHPHVVGAAGLRVRSAASLDVTVPWREVESVAKAYRSLPSGKSVQVEREGGHTVLNIVMAGQTSVDLQLRGPVVFDLPKGPSEPVDVVRIYADDPDGLVRAARRALDVERAIMPHAQEG
jgi:hypothetical protein